MIVRILFSTFVFLCLSLASGQTFAVNDESALLANSIAHDNHKEEDSSLETNDILIQKFLQHPEITKDLEGQPARTVRINLGKSEGASFYQVEVIPSRSIWSEPYKFQLTNDYRAIRLRLTPGQYSVRTRSLDQDRKPGKWSHYEKFWVRYRPLVNAYPGPDQTIEPKGSKTEKIRFEWPKANKATSYFLRVKNSAGKLIKVNITKSNWLLAELETNAEYRWSVTPISDNQEINSILRNDKLMPYTKFKILEADESARGTVVKIKSHPLAKLYQFEVIGIDSKENGGQPSIFDSYDGSMRFRLKPGEYEMRARTIYKDETRSEWSAPKSFFIKRFDPQLVSPAEEEVVESTDDKKSLVKLQWSSDGPDSNYEVFIFNESQILIRTLKTKENTVAITLPHNQTYKWLVKSYSPREPASDKPDPSEAARQFSIDEYIKLDLSPAEESSQTYGWYRHILSNENYYGENYEENSTVKQKLFGGMGEIAAGHWSRKQRWGILGTYSLGGFQFRKKNYVYSNFGIFVGRRFNIENGDRFRVWFGIGYRETPEVLTNPFTSEVNYNTIKSMGPTIAASYQHPLNEKYGISVTGTLYDSRWNKGTPNGMDQIPSISQRFGINGTYTWSQSSKLVLGYTYRKELARYYSSEEPGKINKTSIDGSYFNFAYEFGLAEKEK